MGKTYSGTGYLRWLRALTKTKAVIVESRDVILWSKAGSRGSDAIKDLVPELLMEIFICLDIRTRIRLRRVCRYWKYILLQPDVNYIITTDSDVVGLYHYTPPDDIPHLRGILGPHVGHLIFDSRSSRAPLRIIIRWWIKWAPNLAGFHLKRFNFDIVDLGYHDFDTCVGKLMRRMFCDPVEYFHQWKELTLTDCSFHYGMTTIGLPRGHYSWTTTHIPKLSINLEGCSSPKAVRASLRAATDPILWPYPEEQTDWLEKHANLLPLKGCENGLEAPTILCILELCKKKFPEHQVCRIKDWNVNPSHVCHNWTAGDDLMRLARRTISALTDKLHGVGAAPTIYPQPSRVYYRVNNSYPNTFVVQFEDAKETTLCSVNAVPTTYPKLLIVCSGTSSYLNTMARSTRAATGRKSPAAPPPPPPEPQEDEEDQSEASEAEDESAAAAAALSTSTVMNGEEAGPPPPLDVPVHRPVNVFGGHLTDEIRRAIQQKHEEEPDMSQVQLTEWLDKTYGIKVNRTTVGRTLQRTRTAASTPRRPAKKDNTTYVSIVRQPKKDLDEAVYEWYLEKTDQQNSQEPYFGVSDFRDKAMELAQTGQYDVPPKAKFTDKWMTAFLKRFSLQLTPLSEDGQPIDMDAMVSASGPSASEERTVWPHPELLTFPPENYEEGDASEDDLTGKRLSNGVVKISGDGSDGKSHRWTSQQHISKEMRLALQQKREEDPNISQHQLSGWLNATYGVRVHRATIGRNLKRVAQEAAGVASTAASSEPSPKKSKALTAHRARRSQASSAGALPSAADVVAPEVFEQMILDWFNRQIEAGHLPTDKDFSEKARELKRQIEPQLGTRVSVSLAWRNSFRLRYGFDKGFSSSMTPVKINKNVANLEASADPGMVEVHASVNLIRKYVFNADYDGETKKDLMQGLDDIYIKLGDANRKLKDSAKR
ncbi:hypothetical protein BV898_06705 [Hypsibius exemplaris]|uniref:HTH CENPB-type domain-containing protein n=1 Tax=Hypsibius exemplaris TaxID=2072580 RepID=A0A1W0WVS3_HYPEX|nr:hypothetical protein BV898_06705 [Hypsibius exemplaris]